MTPVYRAPIEATVRSVVYQSGPNSFYFRSAPHWIVELSLSPRFTLRIGHLSGIATEVPGYPGYFQASLGNPRFPWVQIEFQIADHQENADVSVYDLLDPAEKDALQKAMKTDMTDPQSPRYSPYAAQDWLWKAEAVLSPAYAPLRIDFSSIHTRFGGWSERNGSGVFADELFAIFKIQKASALYVPARYDSGLVTHIVSRLSNGGSFQRQMPDPSSVNVFYPAGEVLEETAGSLLIKWRDVWRALSPKKPCSDRDVIC